MGLLAFLKGQGLTADRVLDKALGNYELPSFSAGTLALLRLLRDPDAPTAALARGIESNPALLVKVLRTVNSASFGMRRQIGSAQQAAVLMGRSQLESLVVSIGVKDSLPSVPAQGFEPRRFWFAASRRASIARGIADRLHPQTQAEAFTAGLLQDMAIPLLAAARPKEYCRLLTHWHATPGVELDDLEDAEFGWNHGAVGASMAERWGLPKSLCAGIDGHHIEDGDEAAPAVRLVGPLREVDGGCVARLVERCQASHSIKADDVIAVVAKAEASAQELMVALG